MGYHERTYTKVQRVHVGDTADFRDGKGPLPRAIMVGQGTQFTMVDQYGNQSTIGSSGAVEVSRIFDGIQVAYLKVVTSGRLYLLW